MLTSSSGMFGDLPPGCLDRVDEEADASLEFGGGALEGGQRLGVAAGLACRVGDAPMDHVRRARELRADLAHAVAEADHIVEAPVGELVQVLRPLSRDVDAAFAY